MRLTHQFKVYTADIQFKHLNSALSQQKFRPLDCLFMLGQTLDQETLEIKAKIKPGFGSQVYLQGFSSS